MFDGLPEKFDPLVFSPGKEGLRKLSMLLRAQMPERFRFNFSSVESKHDCGTIGCAIGLARYVWPGAIEPTSFEGTWSPSVERAFGISEQTARALFFSAAAYGTAHHYVTPLDVADAIDRYLATGKVT